LAAAETAGFWAHKPWWCQPWSILATGLLSTGGSWFLLQRWWINVPLTLLVLAWWLLFLVLVPAAWRRELAASASAAPAPAADPPDLP
jgi:hypothetical protein